MSAKEVKRFRKPILDAMKTSPFGGLMLHADKVVECVDVLPELVKVYVKGEFASSHGFIERISMLENEADMVKQNIREHLPRSFFMPTPRSDLLLLLKEQDRIADFVQDVAQLMDLRPTEIPAPIARGFLSHVEYGVKAVHSYRKALAELENILNSAFRKKDIARLLVHVQKLQEQEHKADEIEKKVTKQLFAMEDQLSPVALIHLTRIIDRVDQVANCAETAGNRLVSIVAR
jgi:predicted phosphate transport protein (TIGR00153 family)